MIEQFLSELRQFLCLMSVFIPMSFVLLDGVLMPVSIARFHRLLCVVMARRKYQRLYAYVENISCLSPSVLQAHL